jgi:hypothetical protein
MRGCEASPDTRNGTKISEASRCHCSVDVGCAVTIPPLSRGTVSRVLSNGVGTTDGDDADVTVVLHGRHPAENASFPAGSASRPARARP